MPFSKNSCHVVPSQFDWFLYNTSFNERYFSIISSITTLVVGTLIVRKCNMALIYVTLSIPINVFIA